MNYHNRTYLDYNATAPVFTEILSDMETWPMGNPSSVHAAGKKIRRVVQEVRDDLYQTFKLAEREFDLFFHSGATEGINTIVKSLALECKKEGRPFIYLYGLGDHSCVVNQVEFLGLLGFECHGLELTKTGEIDLERLEEKLKGLDQSALILLNWTWVNNETGLVSPLTQVSELKKKYRLFVHVDAVQAIGKIKQWCELDSTLDSYTFSAHKFGALKGTGFSFLRHQDAFFALLNGGGQQGQMRSGTENTWGIVSIKKALDIIKRDYDFDSQNEAKLYIEEKLTELMGENGCIAAHEALRNGNTIYFVLYKVKAQTVSMALDMAGLDVSNGSACSSGAVIPSRVLMGMGFSEEEAISAIRLSFGPFFKLEEAKELWPRLENILKRFV